MLELLFYRLDAHYESILEKCFDYCIYALRNNKQILIFLQRSPLFHSIPFFRQTTCASLAQKINLDCNSTILGLQPIKISNGTAPITCTVLQGILNYFGFDAKIHLTLQTPAYLSALNIPLLLLQTISLATICHRTCS